MAQELGELELEELQLDSTSIKVHLAAVGGRRGVEEKKQTRTAVVALAALAEV
jgi:hypothetical protein